MLDKHPHSQFPQDMHIPSPQFAIISMVLILISMGITIALTTNPFYPISLLIGLILLSYYVVKAIESIEYALPPIVCLFWLVYFEPAPCDILAAVAITIYLLNICIGKEVIHRLSFPDIALLSFLLFNLAGSLKSQHLSVSALHFSLSFYLIIFYFLFSRTIKSYSQLDKLIKYYAIPCTITAFVMIFQWYSFGDPLFFGVKSIFDSLQTSTASFIPFYSGRTFMEWGRSNAFFKDPNVAGPFLIPIVIFSLAMMIHKREYYKYFIPLAALCSIAVFLSLSRGAAASLIIGIALVLTLSFNLRNIFKISIILTCLITSVLIGYFLSDTKFNRFTDTNFGMDTRLERLENGLETIKENSIIGVGFDKKAPHDSFLARFTQAGIIGGLSFLCFYAYLIFVLFSKYRQANNVDEKTINLTLLVTLLTSIPLGLVIDMIHWRHFWFFAALSSAAIRIKQDQFLTIFNNSNVHNS